MGSHRVTLKEIAADLNVSRTTVHRALHGKEGISEELRQAVLARAQALGYTTNYIASSLKRKTKRLAVVLPQKEGAGQFYHKYFWDAIDTFYPEASSLNVEIDSFPFQEDKHQQIAILDKLFHNGNTEYHGILTMPLQNDEELRQSVERFSYKNVPVVLIDSDLPDSGRLCCIAPHDRLTGRLGAEILTAITHKPGKILIASGSTAHAAHMHNLEGFREYLNESANEFQPLIMQNYGNYQKCYQESMTLLQSHPDIVAFYSVTARDTIPLAQAVIDCGLAGKLRGVGSDLFPQNAEFLKQGILQALIYKNAYDKGRLGFEVLFSYVVKNILPESDKMTVPIGVIMKNNLHFFKDFI
ncbi:MAG: LacI family DNA-binding transcriptional regulator [Oscillospiraceae bacterium]|jgi:LacI family transcriptional regulator